MRTKIFVLFTLIAFHCRAEGLKESIHHSGLIWIVVAVLMIVLIGIFAYLFRLEKKLKEIEKQ